MVTSRQLEIISTICVLTAISVVIFGLRIYARTRIAKAFGMDDWLMAAAFVWILSNEATSLAQVHFGSGLHDVDYNPSFFSPILKVTYVWHITHIMAMCLVKLSILAFFLRLSVKQSQRAIVYVVTAITLTGYAVLLGTTVFQCHPISNAWNSLTYPGGCINIQLNMSAASVFNIITDITIYLMPVPVIVVLQTSTRRKWGLLSIFIVGAVPIVASIARFYSLATLDWSRELMWQGARVNTWTVVELNVALMAACMPAMKLIFFKVSSSAQTTPIVVNTPIPLHPYPLGDRPGTISSDVDNQTFETGQISPDIKSPSGIRLSGVIVSRPSESQECIVQESFYAKKGS